MSIFTTPEQREAGRANFDAAVRRHAVSRRDFMKGLLAAGAAVPVTAAAYYGYQKWQGNPVKAGLCVRPEDWPYGSSRRRKER